MNHNLTRVVAACIPLCLGASAVNAALPGGTLDSTEIPKYVTDLVIPGVMKNSGNPNEYQIAVKRFKQQMLPTQGCVDVNNGGTQPAGACKKNGSFKPTKVWGYGPASDVPPNVAPVPAAQSQFNNPSFTVEATQNVPITVDWINDLVKNNGKYERYQSVGLEVDATLHWANPGAACLDGIPRTDCAGDNAKRYRGPVPMVTHVHGAHTTPESDGYTEAWYLPAANNINCVLPANAQDGTRNNHTEFVCEGTLANGFDVAANTGGGMATFTYPNDQPTTTLWYHDHSLGLTRLNVYAMGAGFWNIRLPNGREDGLRNAKQILPGPASAMGEDPNFDPLVRAKIREIPIAIQDKGFNANGTLFYPKNRAFFEGLGDGSRFDKNAVDGLDIPFLPDAANSDIAPIWNPEVFFNTNVVNGVVWPKLEVADEQYRLRMLNGANGRFYNLEMYVVNPMTNEIDLTQEVPFYQIGAEQSLLPRVVKVTKGCKVQLAGDGIEPAPGTCPAGNEADFAEEALLMGPAERADVIVNFTGLEDGTLIRMINTGPDAPFGGFPDIPADSGTSGQVMQFVVNFALKNPAGDPSTEVDFLRLKRVELAEWKEVRDASAGMVRDLALLEEESELICVFTDAVTGFITQDTTSVPPTCDPVAGSVPFGPKAAVLGIDGRRGGTVQLWDDPITQDPKVGSSERWQFWNWSADAHPIHIHLVKFRVLNRREIGGASRPPTLTERGWKDTVIAYPGEMTQVAAKFDLPGLYVWHCHLLEHEDNEMMVPYCVTNADGTPGPGCTGLF